MEKKKLNFIFIVQGEGRGHMTQAISLRDMLERAGHTLSCVLVGKSKRREIPAFFFEKIKSEVVSFESPNFVTDKKGKAIQIFPTITENLKRTGFFLSNLKVPKHCLIILAICRCVRLRRNRRLTKFGCFSFRCSRQMHNYNI